MGKAIDVEHLCLTRNGTEILHDLTFSCDAGKIMSIIGPNGCGKSTLLQAMTRLLPIQSGTIRVDGADITGWSRKELARHVAILTQFHQAPDDMTVEELVRLGRFPYHSLYRKWSDEDAYCVRRALESTRLEDYVKCPVRNLSGGEQQRVWLAVLLAQRSPILLLDEPTTYLDIRHQLYMMKLLRHCQEKLHLTIVIVLHDMNQALRYTDEVVVMKEGRIVTTGKPSEVITPNLVAEVFGVQTELLHTSAGEPVLVTVE